MLSGKKGNTGTASSAGHLHLGESSAIGSGGTDISMNTLMASIDGSEASVKNAQVNNAVNKNYEGNMNVQTCCERSTALEIWCS